MQEGENMKKNVTFDTPALYGDHHVMEVRRILLEVPGVEDVYASSGFRIVEVTFDDEKISEAEISQKLGEAGYLGNGCCCRRNKARLSTWKVTRL
jgi:copper chaperone CopZ